jgi:hypothetical protein
LQLFKTQKVVVARRVIVFVSGLHSNTFTTIVFTKQHFNDEQQSSIVAE